MFHVNEACNGKGTLKIENGKMTIHVSLAGKSILKVFLGTAKKAEKNETKWIDHSEDTVTYSDGMTEKVFGFDIPVEKLDEEFDLAILGKKGQWHDHKVIVSDVE